MRSTHLEVTFQQWAGTYLPPDIQLILLVGFGRRRAIAHLFIMFSAWTSQKFMKFSLQVGHSFNLKHSKSPWRRLIVLRKLQNQNIESCGHNACLITGTFENARATAMYGALVRADSLRKCLHLSDILHTAVFIITLSYGTRNPQVKKVEIQHIELTLGSYD